MAQGHAQLTQNSPSKTSTSSLIVTISLNELFVTLCKNLV